MDINHVTRQLKAYAEVEISADISMLNDNQKIILSELIAAGQYADAIFWRQSSHDALSIRHQFQNQPGPLKKYIELNYGPYDRINSHRRFVGKGPAKKPLGAGFYPDDMTREEFLDYIKNHPEQKGDLQSLYTIIERNQGLFTAISYHKYYGKEINQMIFHLGKKGR